MKKQTIMGVVALAATLSTTIRLQAMDSQQPATGDCQFKTCVRTVSTSNLNDLSEEFQARINEINRMMSKPQDDATNPSLYPTLRAIKQKYGEIHRHLTLVPWAACVNHSVYNQMDQLGKQLGLVASSPDSSPSQSNPISKKQSESKSTMLQKTLKNIFCCFRC